MAGNGKSQKIQIMIEFTAPGEFRITYPRNDLAQVLGLLDIGKARVLHQMFDEGAQSTGRVLPVTGMLNLRR